MMGIALRRLLVAAALSLVAHAQTVQLEAHPCDNIRRDWRTITPGQQATFISAINQLVTSGQYGQWVTHHTDPAIDRYAHSTDGLFPWHRYFIFGFENLIRSLGGVYSCVSIPYWDWSADSASYQGELHGAPIFVQFGGPGNGQCVEQLPGSPFAAFASFRYPADPVGRFPGGCVNRQQRNDIKINMPQEILDIMTRYNSFAIDPRFRNSFRTAFMNPHSCIHYMVGGSMSQPSSPYDPIFWLHHSFVDKIWWTWQTCHGINNFQPTFLDVTRNTQYSASDAMPGWPGVSPMMVMDIRTCGGRGYNYAPSALESTPQWQQAMATPYICAQRATARHFNLNTNVTYSQRELDVIDTYAATMRQLEGVTNDTAMISYLAARKTCEKNDAIMTYKGATDYAKKMAMTEQELMSNMQSPCVNVDVGNVDEALANARRFDQMRLKEMDAVASRMLRRQHVVYMNMG